MRLIREDCPLPWRDVAIGRVEVLSEQGGMVSQGRTGQERGAVKRPEGSQGLMALEGGLFQMEDRK
jgi:hypothetical protein